MIVSIKGRILDKKPDSVIIDINGLGYLCFISTNTYNQFHELMSKMVVSGVGKVMDEG